MLYSQFPASLNALEFSGAVVEAAAGSELELLRYKPRCSHV